MTKDCQRWIFSTKGQTMPKQPSEENPQVKAERGGVTLIFWFNPAKVQPPMPVPFIHSVWDEVDDATETGWSYIKIRAGWSHDIDWPAGCYFRIRIVQGVRISVEEYNRVVGVFKNQI